VKCASCGLSVEKDQLECPGCGELLLEGAGTEGTLGGVTLPTSERPTLAEGDEPTEFVSAAPTGASQPTAPAAEIPPGSVLAGRYEVLSVLGRGGMGVVYKAKDRELDRLVALKTIRTGGGEEGDDALRRFKQELLLSRKVSHRNVVRIHDIAEAEGIRFFTMEWIDGKSLKSLVKEKGRLSPDEAVELSRGILGALEEAHRQGVIHRDLKPQNVMLDAKGTPFVMDFGIARSQDETGVTATGAVVGTPDYMSPEQVRGDKVGPASDLYAYGVMLFEMLSGELPFTGESAVSRLMARLSQPPRPLPMKDLPLPRHLQAIVHKCLERDVAHRYQSATEVLNDLGRGQVDSSLVLRARRSLGRNRSAVAAGAAVVVVAAAAWWAGSRQSAGPPAPETPASVETLAVLPLTNATGAPELEWMRSGIAEMLVTDLGQSRFVRPVPAERVYRVLRQLGVDDQGRYDEATLDQVAARAPAGSLLYGQYVGSGDTLRFDLFVRRTGAAPQPIKIERPSADVLAVVDEISRSIKERLDVSADQLRGDEDRPIAEVSTASLAARRGYGEGLAALRRGAPTEAVSSLEAATAEDPRFAMAWAKLSEARMELGEHREAVAAAERAVALAEDAPLPLADRFQIQANAALATDDYAKAVASLEELAGLYPDDPDVRLSLARSRERLGNLPEALKDYERVVELAPDYGAALLGLGRIQVMAGRSREAVHSLNDALRSGDFDDQPGPLAMLHAILGVAHRELGDMDSAEEHLKLCLDLRRSIGDRQGEADALMNLADVAGTRGQLATQIKLEKQALGIHQEMGNEPGASAVLHNIGMTHLEAGDLEEALAAFRQTLQIETERQDHVAMANRLDQIALVYRRMGRYDDALVYLAQAASHLEESHEPRERGINLRETGLVRMAQGLYSEALESMLEARPLFEEIHNERGTGSVDLSIGEIYRRQGRYDDAWKAYQSSLAIYAEAAHDQAEVEVPLARLLVDVGRIDEAAALLDEATSGHHGGHGEALMPEILLIRADVQWLRGQEEAAAKSYDEANVRANLSGRKVVAVESRIALGRLLLGQGRNDAARRLLERTRAEAAEVRLRPLEAEATVALAEARSAAGDFATAENDARDAIRLAQRYDGRPVLARAQAVLAEALEGLGRGDEAADALGRAADELEWIHGATRPEHAQSFTRRPDVQALARRIVEQLEGRDRAADAAALRGWLAAGEGTPKAGP